MDSDVKSNLDDTRRALRLLRWYPTAWRERYGEEFVDHLASIHRGGDVKHRICQEFRDWNILGGALVDHLSDGRVESICWQSL